MLKCEIGQRVVTPIGNGEVISQKMRHDVKDIASQVCVKLDAKANDKNYSGTNFPPEALTPEENG